VVVTICPNCGAELPSRATRCPGCGRRFRDRIAVRTGAYRAARSRLRRQVALAVVWLVSVAAVIGAVYLVLTILNHRAGLD
jgi:uncharacterized membrane protein YvbJ